MGTAFGKAQIVSQQTPGDKCPYEHAQVERYQLLGQRTSQLRSKTGRYQIPTSLYLVRFQEGANNGMVIFRLPLNLRAC